MTQSFAALGVSAPVVGALSRLGIESPFAVQSLALPGALAGVDILAASPTGSGETLAFGIPTVSPGARAERFQRDRRRAASPIPRRVSSNTT